MKKISAFLPCRKGSQRVPKKNIKPFGSYNNGLIELKLNQLLSANNIQYIVLSTNDDEIIEYATSLKSPKILIHKRIEQLALSTTSTDELVQHALDLIPEGDILWTHTTSPFITAALYDKIILQYYKALTQGYDSLMTTSLIHGFIWNDSAPINYDRTKEKWPRTQTIEPLYEINSGVFLNSASNYKNLKDRIGLKPYMYILDKIEGFDIDWEEDFRIFESMVSSKIAEL